jgi:phage shock protein E
MSFIDRIMSSFSSEEVNLSKNAVLIDVRTSIEFNSGHIDGALSIPISDLSQRIGGLIPNRETEIIVYCQSGARSAAAKNYLAEMGYANVANGGGVTRLANKLQKQIC